MKTILLSLYLTILIIAGCASNKEKEEDNFKKSSVVLFKMDSLYKVGFKEGVKQSGTSTSQLDSLMEEHKLTLYKSPLFNSTKNNTVKKSLFALYEEGILKGAIWKLNMIHNNIEINENLLNKKLTLDSISNLDEFPFIDANKFTWLW